MLKKIFIAVALLLVSIMPTFATENFYDEVNQIISESTNIIKLNPNNADAYYQRSIKLRVHDAQAEAILDLEKAIKLNPNHTKAKTDLEGLKRLRNHYIRLLKDENYKISKNPENSMSYFTRAMILCELGKYNEAISDLNKVIDLEPNNTNAIKYKKYIQNTLLNLYR